MYVLENIKDNSNLNEEMLIQKALKKYNIKKSDVLDYTILKKSLDARNKSNIFWNYSIGVDLKNNYNLPIYSKKQIPKIENNFSSKLQPIIIGSGPAGLFCALEFIKNGICPIIIEKGQSVENRKASIENFNKTRVLNESSNIQFGEGGAGTFSDGKLNTSNNSPYINYVLETFVKFGAPKEILYLSKPHIGTDNLYNILINIRKYIEKNGGKYYFENELKDFKIENDTIEVITNKKRLKTNHLILATGHSAHDIYNLLLQKGATLKPKNFAIGVRIEHNADDISFSQYGKNFKLYPTADYKLVYHDKNSLRSCFSFCMCPGGFIMPSQSDKDTIVTNGMSYFARDNSNSNSALIVNINASDYYKNSVLDGIEFIKQIEKNAFNIAGSNYNAPFMYLKDLNIKPSKITTKVNPTYPFTTHVDFTSIFPDYVIETLKNSIEYFENKISGFANPNAVITAPETRTSSPITIVRNENYCSNLKNVFPIGEGAGYSGGITTSAIDGIKVARKIISQGL